jgi:FkbM family methyltransferase
MTPVQYNGVSYETNDPVPLHYWLWNFEGDLAFDVGANHGQSLRAMVTAGRFRRAVALEPSAEAWEVLVREFGSDGRVTLLQGAAAERTGTLELSVCAGAIQGGELLAPELVGHSPDLWWSGETGRRTVRCVTLDALAAQYGVPQLVKVDTEGGEVRVLEGAGTLMGRTEWLVEWHSPALRDTCQEMLSAYRLEVIPYPYPDGVPPYDAEPQNGWIRATL